MTNIDLKSRMEAAAEAVWQAGKVTLRYFQAELSVETKSDLSPVTVADRETEAFLVERLSSLYPDDAILGEEFGERAGTSGWRWVVDPIDGTRSFVQGVPLYGVMAALEAPDGEPALGAVCLPALGELVAAARGEGCWWNGRRARVSDVTAIAQACVLGSGPECFEETGTQETLRRFESLSKLSRTWGDCYGYVLVATGRAEVMLDPVLKPWDTFAVGPLVEEAGGVFTDWSGRATARGESGVASNRALAPTVRELIDGGDVPAPAPGSSGPA